MAKAAKKSSEASQTWKDEGLTKAEWIAREAAKAVNAGKAWNLETVDFSNPNRPLTCLEVDFPIVPINALAKVEASSGAAKKPIYLSSKWWARRQPSVFRSLMIAAAIKAPDDPAEAAKLVWNVYYGNHQKKGTFKHLKVADIFMGGGTTLVEGSRLGMQMYGNDLNPVAWFVVKNELAQVDKEEVVALLAEVEAEVKPKIMPFYACDCPRGHKGKWTQISTGKVMGRSFDPLSLTTDQRNDYSYAGPEIIYTFWAKHGPCQVTGCGHRTPIMTTPVMAVKSISIKAWKRKCKHCGEHYDIEERDARMAPSVELVVADTEHPFAAAKLNIVGSPESAVCPHCGKNELFGKLAKPFKKSIELSLLVHPDWLKGESYKDKKGNAYGGSADDSVDASIRWNHARSVTCKLVEVRGTLPDTVKLLDGTLLKTGKAGGTVPGKSNFACAACGTTTDVRDAIAASKTNSPTAMYAIQGFCPECRDSNELYGGRFFAPVNDASSYNAACIEWENRKNKDLKAFWPTNEVPFGFMTAMNNGDIRIGHGFTHWWKMFNPLQLLVHSQVLRSIAESQVDASARHAVLAIMPQVLRANCMFSFWNLAQDCLEPLLGSSNFHPKSNVVGNCVFQEEIGRGTFSSYAATLKESIEYINSPWDLLSTDMLPSNVCDILTSKTWKLDMQDRVRGEFCRIDCRSSSDLASCNDKEFDLVITDPPFGGLLHYSELSDFFHSWLRLALYRDFPDLFGQIETPKSLEAVANRARHGADADGFYQRLLTACWAEARRILKPAGILGFTFHHSEDAPWVSVLESLFDAGFYLEATYPIRSDETKGEGAKPGTFGSQTIEYDIIHVCRQRYEEPKPISWPKLRRQVLQDVRELKELLEHHQEEGLPEADLQVIRRGKALEYFSRHYGKVYKDQESPMSVLEALLGINQLLDEEAGGIKEPPPHNAEPFTRMLLRLFDGKAELARDQIQKFLRGTGSAPSDFIDRGWVYEEKKVFCLVPPLELAEHWIGRQRRGMTSDYDQAMFFIGACFESSGINASDTLNNPNFQPHPALGAILTWFKTHGADSSTRNAASIASQLYRSWEGKNQSRTAQLKLFDTLGEDD